MKDFSMEDQVFWVTGAAQGIGAAISAAIVGQGGYVVGLDKRFSKEKEWESGFQVPCDLSKPEQTAQVLERTLLQRQTLHGLVHAAGVLSLAPIAEVSTEQWHQAMQVNCFSFLQLVQVLLPRLRKQKYGRVLAIGSNARHVPRLNMSAYAASKAALHSVVNNVALEAAADGVTCNTLSPGSTLTPMQISMWQDENSEQEVIAGDLGAHRLGIPLKKLAVPQDIASTALFYVAQLPAISRCRIWSLMGAQPWVGDHFSLA